MSTTIKYFKYKEYTVRKICIPGQKPFLVLDDIAKVLGLTLEEAEEICKFKAIKLKDIEGVNEIDFSDTIHSGNKI